MGIREIISEEYGEDMLLMDGYDDCIAGVVYKFGDEPCVAYDRNKVIKKLMEEDGMSHEEAIEFHEFNQAGAYVGENTPCFLETIMEDPMP